MTVNPIPDGYHSVTPYLVVDGAAEAIDWYARAFGATEIMRMAMPVPSGVERGDRIGHAEIKIGDSCVMLSDEWPDMNLRGPKARGGVTASLMIYVPDVDATFARALREGANEERAVQDQFYGDRSGTLVDPFGHRWMISTHVEDVTPEEMQRRMSAMEPA
ncbi:VOC family protein [Sphingomonas tabacisoli]|uniref:VOC family protein n=1 Tax=Sphingomonas tabacisoli TaxID=2249466 RepID=A0ABW4I510_9SPHN